MYARKQSKWVKIHKTYGHSVQVDMYVHVYITFHLQLTNFTFSRTGPRSFDLGLLLAGYMTMYHFHMLIPENNDDHRQVSYKMMDACRSTGKITWQIYSRYMTSRTEWPAVKMCSPWTKEMHYWYLLTYMYVIWEESYVIRYMLYGMSL